MFHQEIWKGPDTIMCPLSTNVATLRPDLTSLFYMSSRRGARWNYPTTSRSHREWSTADTLARTSPWSRSKLWTSLTVCPNHRPSLGVRRQSIYEKAKVKARWWCHGRTKVRESFRRSNLPDQKLQAQGVGCNSVLEDWRNRPQFSSMV